MPSSMEPALKPKPDHADVKRPAVLFDEILGHIQDNLKTAQTSLNHLARMNREAAVDVCNPTESKTMDSHRQHDKGAARSSKEAEVFMQSDRDVTVTGMRFLSDSILGDDKVTLCEPKCDECSHVLGIVGPSILPAEDFATIQHGPLLVNVTAVESDNAAQHVLKFSQSVSKAPTGVDPEGKVAEGERASNLRVEWNFCDETNIDSDNFSSDSKILIHNALSQSNSSSSQTTCGKHCDASLALHPESRVRFTWDAFALIFVVADVILIPLSALHAFNESTLWPRLDLAGSIFWSLDIGLSFRTGYYNDIHLIMNTRDIAMTYVRGWFFVDVILLTIEWLAHVSEWISLFGVNRISRFRVIVRVLRLSRMTKVMDRFVRHFSAFCGHVVLSITRMSVAAVFLVHLFACSWYYVGSRSLDGWVSAEGVRPMSLHKRYLFSVRWTLGQLSGRTDDASGRTSIELIFICVYAVFAVLFKTCFIGAFTTRMIELRQQHDARTKYTATLRRYCQRHQLSQRVGWLSQEYVRRRETFQTFQDDHELIMKLLPDYLKDDILYEMCSPALFWHALFKNMLYMCPKGVHSVCTRSASVVWAADCELVFGKGEACTRMLFVEDGELKYSTCPRFRILMSIWAGDVRGLSIENRIRFKDQICGDGVKGGMWLSEMALWVDWETRGELISLSAVKFVSVNVVDFIITTTGLKELRSLCAVYGRQVVRAVGSVTNLNDLYPRDLRNPRFGSNCGDQDLDASGSEAG
eukprot:TRINITY_DN6767_c0_g1_i1.p1 TRINITY_DN6767_c0_g1~~TRINITY_DN6767_c0_g1_i1.p1  ORF type:complete len:768 (-),score=66.67 TRINITY_DN6767_c0_g1_i1:13-2268(-)